MFFFIYSRHAVKRPDPITIIAPITIIKSMLSEKTVTPIMEPKTSCKYEKGWITEASATCSVFTIMK